MRDFEKLQEIENLGEEQEEREERERGEPRTGGTTVIPLVQAALCALVILALVFLKATDTETYDKVTSWYRSEAAQEIELPKWGEREEATSVPPQAAGVGSLQRV